ncbi:ROK family transcriptional regulator [Actinotalea sp. K2]|uniref:ROK family transcriptional regulator n=1 Tax=Actinotalea sp. K2 TaxID=2939438 RepID=UPI00201719FB|nr:ROK family transcriptional regulator [Actinotalea sp. K2]MCL3859760.1 ROK family transcriptional regulator [Actinotalea sp. K2]
MSPTWKPLTGTSRAVALEVLVHGPLSRVELARRMEMSQGSLTRLTKPLVDRGLLLEVNGTRGAGSGVGRPQKPLDVLATAHHFVGVKLTGETAYGVLTTLRAEVVAQETETFDDTSPQNVTAVISRLVSRLSTGAPSVTAVGVSLGGHAADHQSVASAPYLHWVDVPLAAMVEAATSLPTVVENDLVALTEAESWFGAGPGLDQFAVVTVGAGVGFGLVVRGHQVTNADIGLGLVGHIPLDPNGPVCFQGHRGCSTAMLSMESIAGAVSVALGRRVTYDQALDLAAAGDPAAGRVVGEAGRALGRMLALVANFTMPRKVVLGGEGVRLVEVARGAIDDALRADRDPKASPLVLEVRPGDFTEWARGAAVVAIQTYVLGVD